VAATVGVPGDHLVFGNGGDEIITLLGRALLDPGDEVVIPRPAFEPYETVARAAGATIAWSPLRDYAIDLDDVLARVTRRTKLVCLSNPHNPTATAMPRAAWDAFAARCPDDILILLDEAYVDFVEEPAAVADGLASLAARPGSLLILRTFSKIAGLAGLRVGYAIAAPAVIETLERIREPFNVGRLAQAGAAAAIADHAHREATRRLIWREKRWLSDALAVRGLACAPSQANFLIVRLGGDASATTVAMGARGVLVRDGTGIGLPGHLRIAIGTREHNTRMLAALDQALGRESAPAPSR
jgi:histidinol-phosphate aminotransferase